MKIIKLLCLCLSLCTCAKAQWVLQQVPTTNELRDVYFPDSTEGWVTALYDGIFHTSNGGDSWEQQYSGFIGHFSGISNNELWAIGRRDTLLHTTNGGDSWTKVNINEFTDFDSTWYIATVYFYDSNIGWIHAVGWKFGSYDAHFLKTTNGGLSWVIKDPPFISDNSFIQFFNSLEGVYTGSYMPLYKSTDGGENWEILSGPGYMTTYGMQFVTPNIGWITTDGPVGITAVLKTTDGGVNWFNSIFCFCYLLHPYFIDSLKGWNVKVDQVIHTSDGGLNWNFQYTYPPSFSPRKIFFADSLNGWIIGHNGLILHTSTGGIIPVELTSFTTTVLQNEKAVQLNWTTATETNNSGFEIQRTSPLPSPYQGEGGETGRGWETIGFVPGFGTTIEPKSYSFTDEDITTGAYKYQLKQIDFDGSFTYSNEIEVDVDFAPNEFVLYQNYPNPFNPSTTIKYEIPLGFAASPFNKGGTKGGFVTLKVYDVLGNEVATLVNEEIQPGTYEVDFHPESSFGNLASGIYFYQLIAGSYIQTKKMILAK